MRAVLFIMLCLLLLAASSDALFGLGKKKRKEKEEAAKKKEVDPADAMQLGLESMMEQMGDPEAMRATMEMMKNPGTCAFHEDFQVLPPTLHRIRLERCGFSLFDFPAMHCCMIPQHRNLTQPHLLFLSYYYFSLPLLLT
jgi:hypothetical protein